MKIFVHTPTGQRFKMYRVSPRGVCGSFYEIEHVEFNDRVGGPFQGQPGRIKLTQGGTYSMENLVEENAKKPAKPKIPTGWHSMRSAPKDGTMVLITETPNGEHYNVMPASYMNLKGGDPRLGENPIGIIGWWGIDVAKWSGEGGDCPLPVRFKPIACHPLCWRPFPDRESMKDIRRREGQIYRQKKTKPSVS